MKRVLAKDIFKGKAIVVTGGTSGIGAATARVFAELGGQVMLTGRNEERGNAVRDDIRKAGGTAEFSAGDVTDSKVADRVVAETVKKFGRLDVLFAAAGILWARPFLELEDAEWAEFMATNVDGMFFFGRAAARHMIKQGEGGAIINMGSIAASIAFPGFPAYGVNMAARVGLTKQMAADLGPHGIRVNVICPGDVDTPMMERLWTAGTDNLSDQEWRKEADRLTPTGRVTKPEEIAELVAFIASGAPGNMNAAVIAFDGGESAIHALPQGFSV